MNELQKRFDEETNMSVDIEIRTYVNSQDTPTEEYYSANYVKWLESQLTWRKVEDELPEDNEEIWVETSRYKGAGRREGVCWYTCYGEEIRTPQDWLPIPN